MFNYMNRILRNGVVRGLQRKCHTQRANRGPHTCGIPPFKDPLKDAKRSLNAPEKVHFKLPGHLIRPPCMPGSEPGKEQTCKLEAEGVYCPSNRIHYKYPPFSENLDVIRGDGKVCWWFKESECAYNKDEANTLERPDVEIFK